jgi:hypothetical protein
VDVIAYHDRTSADHQAHFNDLFPKGYRMTSVSVYGARGSELYAAVWVKRDGPDWSAVHGVDAAGYQAAFNTAVAAGFKPVLLAATGPANNPVFAGTFEQRVGPVPLTRSGLTRGDDGDPNTLDHWISQARVNGWMPAAVAIYGSAPSYCYAAVFVDNPTGINWGMQGLADSAGDYQQRFDATVPVGARPVEVAVSPDDRYASIFRDDLLGDWFARHELTSAGYQQASDRRLRAYGFGGPWNFERDDAGGGLSASVVDVARMLAMLDVRLNNPVLSPGSIANLFTLAAAAGRGHGFDAASVDDAAAGHYSGSKGGDLPESSQNCIRYSTTDFSMAVCFNRHDIAEGTDGWWCPDFPALLSVVRTASWTGADLFPNFGMPTLVPVFKPPPRPIRH